jgi:hypothetical protein
VPGPCLLSGTLTAPHRSHRLDDARARLFGLPASDEPFAAQVQRLEELNRRVGLSPPSRHDLSAHLGGFGDSADLVQAIRIGRQRVDELESGRCAPSVL